MRFIRAYWGNLDAFDGRHRKEIQNIASSTKLNDYIYVWGKDNFEFITSLGLEAQLVNELPTEYGTDYLYDSHTYMFHKLEAVRKGCLQFGSVIFLDWDTIQLKDIDNNFYELLRVQDSKIQMPLYTYPKNYKQIVLNQWRGIPPKEKEYIDKQITGLVNHHYSWDDNWVTPNAGFIYCTDATVIDELYRLCTVYEIQIASEEMSMVEYSKQYCDSVNEYIERFEPLVCDAKDFSHFNQTDLNRLIESKIQKDLYFLHK